ncbi:glycosyltransferase [Roseovarius sp. MMSF_3281]|uniref:glycosyltransferase n=1 Tax=Roseovarius sp. MMSF_3281 TaxID=3046694 RepID=UPI00273DA2ED|nr:glycosyltransferase [Roseovarius sp. MMSF_3281]
MNPLIRSIAAAPSKRRNKALHRLIFGRGFNQDTNRRLLILFEPNRISYSSVFPFLDYAPEFRARYDAEIRCLPVDQALQQGIPSGLSTATHIIAQTWLTNPKERHEQLERLIASLTSGVRWAYLDSFANADIRWAGIFESAALYYKKSLFIDHSAFTRPSYGHTNLSEYYGRLYGLEDDITDWGVPQSVLSKLRIAPNFLTDPDLSASLLTEPAEHAPDREIDLHARLGGVGADGWYGEMRRHAARAVDELSGLRVAKGTGVSRPVFARELERSKACFSPFGYGELCWRDIEAIAAGCVLIKPDMSHLRTEPDLFRDGETYIACRWDFADLADKLTEILADDERRLSLTANAKHIAKTYLESAGPVSTYADLFES